ncbi:MAG: HYR domain-containing protein [Zetaproteobacteria bacterium]|nr:HYR domain-containing protein [Zetaproteobacteria bacterium]
MHFHIITSLILTLILTACSSGGNSNSPATTAPSATTVSGSVIKGPVTNATIKLYQINANGSRGALISSTTTDALGNWSATTATFPFEVVATGGSYIDEVSNITIPLTTNELSTIVAQLHVNNPIPITPITTALSARIKQLTLLPANSLSQAINQAEAETSLALGFNPISTQAFNPLTIAVSATHNEKQYATLILGLDALANNNVNLTTIKNSAGVLATIQALANDALDGVMNGKSADGATISIANMLLADLTGAGLSEINQAAATQNIPALQGSTLTPGSTDTISPVISGAANITVTAISAAGNSATATANVQVINPTTPLVDTTPPVMTAPANIGISISAATAAGTPVTNQAIANYIASFTAIDAVDGVITVTNNAPTTTFPIGLTSIKLTAQDQAGNSSNATAFINVLPLPTVPPSTDSTPPLFTVPNNLFLSAVIGATTVPSSDAAVIAYIKGVSANDAVDGVVTVNNTMPTTLAIGSNSVYFYTVDAAGNSAIQAVNIEVFPSDTLVFTGTALDEFNAPVVGATPFIECSNGSYWESTTPSNANGFFAIAVSATTYLNQSYFTFGIRDLPTLQLQAAWYQQPSLSTNLAQLATQVSPQNLPININAQLVLKTGATLQINTNASAASSASPGAIIQVYDATSYHKKVVAMAGAATTSVVLPAGSFTVKYEPTTATTLKTDTLFWGNGTQTFDPALAMPITMTMRQMQTIAFTEQLMSPTQISSISTSYINSYRQGVGLPSLTDDPLLALTALNHSTYLQTNINDPSVQGLGGHSETATLPDFTGITATDRYAVVAGAAPTAWSVGEVFYGGSDIVKAVDSYINSVYHQIPLLDSNTTMVGTGRITNGWAVSNTGTTQPTTAHALYLYPANGQTGVTPIFYNTELPDPLLNSGIASPTGPVISMNAPGHTLLVSAATIAETITSTAGPTLHIVDQASDPNARLSAEHIFFFPQIPLKPQTSYTIQVNYSLDGGATQLYTSSFTTGWK